MAIAPFLAMTAAEIRNTSPLPEKVAWMACHFSPYGLGLSNLPRTLPPDSLLMVDDITPIHGHDPAIIAEQLSERAETLHCHAVLLDFQRSGCADTSALVTHLSQAFPFPVVTSDLYSDNGTLPVFLPPVAPSVTLATHLAPWEGRSICLDISPAGEVITLTEAGAQTTILPVPDPKFPGFSDQDLHCHYHIREEKDRLTFTLWRTPEDMEALLEEAEGFGITTAIALYQELHNTWRPNPSPGEFASPT